MSTLAPTDELVLDVLMHHGVIAQVRLLRPDDEPALRALNARVSLRTRMRRYFSVSDAPGDWYVDKLVRAAEGDCALVASLQGEVVALAGFCRLERDPALADLALLIDDAHQSEGLGGLLLEQLAVLARHHGIRAFCADVLADNTPMLHLLRTSGFAVTTTVVSGVVDAHIDLREGPQLWEAVRSREMASQRASLLPVLAPRSVAVIGSTREGSVAAQVRKDLAGFRGSVLSVASHERLLQQVDLAVVAVRADQVLEVARDAARLGVHGLLVLSAGFAEAGDEGRSRQAELLALCRQAGMRLIGPNCLGIVNTDPAVRLNATFCDAEPQAGGVALISQSGAVGVAALRHAERTGVGLSSFVSTGNKADVSGNDLLSYFADDPGTSVVGLYLESFGNAQKFARVAAAVGQSKPVVVLKAGRTAAGAKAGLSHTAAAATPDAAMAAVFHAAGVLRADDLTEMFDLLSLLAVAPLPRGHRVAVIGNSGGPGVLAADACAAAGLVLADLTEQTRRGLWALLPASASVENPVDLLATVAPGAFEQSLRLVLDDPGVDACVVVYTAVVGGGDAPYAAAMAAVAADFPTIPVLAVLPGLGCPPPALCRPGGALSLPFFEFPEPAVKALGRAAAYATWRSLPVVDADPYVPASRRSPVVDVEPGWLLPASATALLESYGIPAARVIAVTDAASAVAAAEALGYPVALKAAGKAIVHKADVGGVALDLTTPDEVAAAFEAMADRVGAGMTSAVVQRMQAGRGGLELIVGLTVDASAGPLVLLGAGGTYTELLDDRVVRMPPASRQAAWDMLASLRCAPRFGGYRGGPALDAEGVVDVLMAVARMSRDLPHLRELDLNPLLVTASGVTVLDARVLVGPPFAAFERSARALSPAAGRQVRGLPQIS